MHTDSQWYQNVVGPDAFNHFLTSVRNFFLASAGAILITTGCLKFITVLTETRIMAQPDPMFRFLHIRQLLFLVALVEIVSAIVVFRTKSGSLKLAIIAWISACFLIYRLGLYLIGGTGYCSCLGTATDWLPFTPEVWDWILKVVLIYLFVCSCAFLLVDRLTQSKVRHYATGTFEKS